MCQFNNYCFLTISGSNQVPPACSVIIIAFLRKCSLRNDNDDDNNVYNGDGNNSDNGDGRNSDNNINYNNNCISDNDDDYYYCYCYHNNNKIIIITRTKVTIMLVA